MDEPRHRRSADEKIDALYEALLGSITSKGALTELREAAQENRRLIEAVSVRLSQHEEEQRQRDKRSEEGKREVRHLFFGIMERTAVALIGALGGAWVAIQAVLSGRSNSQ